MAVAAVFGPGIVVMLADTDGGSVITAAQSGAQWGYRLVLPLVLLIPVLYLIQDVAVRLGIFTGRGHGDLINQYFGRGWAVVSAMTLLVACVGALITEFAGVAGAAQLAGVPAAVSVPLCALALAGLTLAGRYRRVELVAVVLGSLELLFLPAALLAAGHGPALVGTLWHPVVLRRSYLGILAANIGAVVMPWMVFYHQQAVAQKGISRRYLRLTRLDTALGSVMTQVVMIAVVVATAATIGHRAPTSLDTVGEIASALRGFLGPAAANVLFGLGMIGASTVAALVVALAGSWGVAEVLGWRHHLNDAPKDAPGFYALATMVLVASALAVILAPNLVRLSVDVQVLNAALLPVVLGFLLILERRALEPADRMRGLRAGLTWGCALAVTVIGVTGAIGVVTG